MTFLLSLIYWEVLALVFCAFGMVVVSIFFGDMVLDGLFYGTKGDGEKYFSPERVQLFLFTLAVAFQFLTAVLRDPSRFPEVSTSSIALLGGSHVIYLGGKTAATFLGRSK